METYLIDEISKIHIIVLLLHSNPIWLWFKYLNRLI